MTSTTPDRVRWTEAHPLGRRWPTLAAIGLAALTAFGLSGGGDLAKVLAASGLVYLGAAALRKPATAWLVFFGTVVVIVVADILPGDFDATWIILGLAVVFLGYGLLRGAARPADGLPRQALAMVAFGAAAAITLLVSGDAGAYLVAAGLLGHAAWDVYHYRVNRVVVRSMAEFCFVLDTLLAVAMVIVAVRG